MRGASCMEAGVVFYRFGESRVDDTTAFFLRAPAVEPETASLRNDAVSGGQVAGSYGLNACRPDMAAGDYGGGTCSGPAFGASDVVQEQRYAVVQELSRKRNGIFSEIGKKADTGSFRRGKIFFFV